MVKLQSLGCDMKHLLLDANNLLFRARHSCYQRNYENVIVHAFFRSLKPIIEKFSPDYVYFVLDGYPKKRMEMQSDYKGTRVYHDKDGFRAQKKRAESIIKSSVPFVVARHPEAEADDVIADLALALLPDDDEKIVVSSDTDFIQLCQDASNTSLYNPITKEFRGVPVYPYAMWKALRGDSADNIAGIKGIGNKRAAQLLVSESVLSEYFKKFPDNHQTYLQNLDMIALQPMTKDERSAVEYSFADRPLETLREAFTTLKFKSMISDKAWEKYSHPFTELRDGRKYFT
jgi:DNA polymerase-1